MSKIGWSLTFPQFTPPHLSSQMHTVGAANKDDAFTTKGEIWDFFPKVELFGV